MKIIVTKLYTIAEQQQYDMPDQQMVVALLQLHKGRRFSIKYGLIVRDEQRVLRSSLQPDLKSRTATCPIQKQIKCLVSWVTQEPKFLPTTQCQVGLYFLSNSFFMYAAMSFSMLNFSRATLAQSMASCCISSFMSACLITALRSAVDIKKNMNESVAIIQIKDHKNETIRYVPSYFDLSFFKLVLNIKVKI